MSRRDGRGLHGDSATPFSWKSEATSGYGALDDFGVHGFSLVHTLVGPIARVCGQMAKPYPERATADGTRRAVETHDIASALVELENGASGLVSFNRSAWGRKGRIAVQIFGSRGTDRLRPGALQRGAALHGRRGRRRRKGSARFSRGRITRLTAASSRRRAMGLASTTSR
jgi:predicted dehydrogenase